MKPLAREERRQLPPPARGCKRPEYRFEFTYVHKATEQDATYDGYLVLVTTAPQALALEIKVGSLRLSGCRFRTLDEPFGDRPEADYQRDENGAKRHGVNQVKYSDDLRIALQSKVISGMASRE